MSWPPVNTARIGVINRKWPVTVTVTVEPIALAQLAGLQLSATSAGATVTKEDWVSLTTRHMTRFVAALQPAPAENEAGFSAASIAPSRAALATVICE